MTLSDIYFKCGCIDMLYEGFYFCDKHEKTFYEKLEEVNNNEVKNNF